MKGSRHLKRESDGKQKRMIDVNDLTKKNRCDHRADSDHYFDLAHT